MRNLNAAIAKLALQPNAPILQLVTSIDLLCDASLSELRETMGATCAKLFLLKIANLLVARHEYLNRHIHLIAHPVGMLIDPSNGCGLRCPGCVHSGLQTFWDWPSGLLRPDIFEDFINEHGPFAIDLYLANYGEPLLNPKFPQLIRAARRLGLPTFSSTSLSVPSKLIGGVVESGLNFLIVSIDGVSDDVYNIYRRGGSLALALRNLEQLVATKRRLGSYTPVLHWQYLVFEHNAHEIEEAKHLAREIGVNELALVRPFSVSWDDPTIHADPNWQSETIVFARDRDALVRHLGKMREDLADDIIDRHYAVSWRERLAGSAKTSIERDGANAAAGRPPPCNWLYKSLTMDARGRILPCARPPTKSGDLIFSRRDMPDPFNSRMHLAARQLFIDDAEGNLGEAPEIAPYCAKCEHRDQKADIDTQETVRRLLEDVDLSAPLDANSRVALTNW